MIGFLIRKLEIQDMLSQGSRPYLFAFILLSITSCESDFEKKQKYYENGILTSESPNERKKILSYANDTINHWIDTDLKLYHNLKRYKIKLDDQIYFNSVQDKCILFILIQNPENEFQDMIYMILSERYQNAWWFYNGPTYVVIRKRYSLNNSQLPLSFYKLSEKAKSNALDWYYLEKEAGACIKKLFSSGYASYKQCNNQKYLINDKFFETEFNLGMDPDPEKRIEWYLNEFSKSKYVED